jgi:hypothetical protein
MLKFNRRLDPKFSFQEFPHTGFAVFLSEKLGSSLRLTLVKKCQRSNVDLTLDLRDDDAAQDAKNLRFEYKGKRYILNIHTLNPNVVKNAADVSVSLVE